MKKTCQVISVIAALLLLLPFSALSADEEAISSLLCSIVDVIECAPGGDCLRSDASTVNLPYFVKVDIAEKMISLPQGANDMRTTPVQSVTDLDGKLILQGAEDGRVDEDDAIGWTMSIDKDDGRMIFSASREQAGFVIFGACVSP